MRTTHLAGALGLALAAPLALTATSSNAPLPAAQQPVLFYWSATIDPDSDAAPTEFLVRMIEHMRTTHPETNLRVLTDAFGANQTIHWYTEYESLSAREQVEQELDADREWQALIEEAGSVFDLDSDVFLQLFPLGGAGGTDWSKPVRQLWITHSPPDRAHLARRHARRVVEYLEANYEAVDARAYSPDLEAPGTIHWMVDYESADTWEVVRGELLGDESYTDLLREAEGLYLEEWSSELLRDF
jgi:hypothetical protein